MARERLSMARGAWAWRGWAAAVLVAIAVTTVSWAWHSRAGRGGTLADPSRIATGATASHLVLDGMSLDVAADSAVVVSGDAARGVLVVLDRGSVTLDVEGRVARAGFVVQAGEVRVRVVGTRFKVSRCMDGASVEVERGTVEVDTSGSTVRVHAGEAWRSVDPGGAHGETTGAPPSASTTAPPALQPAPGEATAQESGRMTRRHIEAPTTGRRTGKLAPSAPDPAPAKPLAASTPTPTSQQLYEAAAKLEVTDPARAIALYGEVVARGDSWLADALFAQGRLEAARGAGAQARATLTEYLARFPRGPNAEDARLLLDRTR
jgi:hypothetical protein